MRGRIATAVAGLCVLTLNPERIDAQSGIDRAAWLAGCWEARTGSRSTVEMWMPPAGGTMFGTSRTVAGDATRAFEFLRLHLAGDTLVYTAIPSGQRETSFRATRATADSLRFENPAHDFPQRIIYTRLGADSVVARVEGPGRDGATRGFTIPMRRIECTTGAPRP